MSTTQWLIDPAHSEISFKVKHLMITNVKGEFKEFTGSVEHNGLEFLADSIVVTLKAESIFTNNSDRDNHLRTSDFFEAEKYPELTFKGSTLTKVEDDEYTHTGTLTMKDVTKEISLDVEFGGVNKDPWGNEKAGFSVSTKINRKDWGLNWNSTLETGGVLVSDEVKISADLQFVKTVA